MRKFLLGTTAIAGVTALSVATALAAEAPKLSIGGFVNFEATVVDEDVPWGNNVGHYFALNETEIIFQAKGVADNGLEYGAKVEWEAEDTSNSNASGGVDEAGMYFSGGWGLLQLGADDGAEDMVKRGGQSVLGGAAAWDGENSTAAAKFNIAPGGAPYLTNPDIVGDSSDAVKITYFTPKFSGFRAGVSYAPNNTGSTYEDRFADTATNGWRNNIGIGAEWAGEFSGVSVAVSGRYVTAEPSRDGSNVGTTAAPDTAEREDLSSWGVGGVVGYAGFSVGAGYRDNGESNVLRSDTALGADAGKSFDVAVGYATGPYKVGVGYFNSSVDGNQAGEEFETDWFAVTADYTVAPGLGVYIEYDYIELDDGLATTAQDNEAQQIILGTKITF